MTPYPVIKELRTGRRQPGQALAMVRGTALGFFRQAAYEALAGQVMRPLVLVERGLFSRSLDGPDLRWFVAGGDQVSVKKGKGLDAGGRWRLVRFPALRLAAGHQFMVSKARREAICTSLTGREGLLLAVTPLGRNAGRRFMKLGNEGSCVASGWIARPPL